MEPVYLYAYNLAEDYLFSSTSSQNSFNDNFWKKGRESGFFTLGLEAWHTSLVIYDKEIAYGRKGLTIEDIKSRIRTEEPGPIKKILMGHTGLTWELIRRYLDYLSQNAFTAEKYNVLNHNCNVFTAHLCNNLLAKDIPKEYSRAVPNFFKKLSNLASNIFTLSMYLKSLPLKSFSSK